MWHRLKKNHPVIYEAVQWGIFALACASLIVAIIALVAAVI